MDLLTKQFLKIVLIWLHCVYEHISVLVFSLNPLWDFSMFDLQKCFGYCLLPLFFVKFHFLNISSNVLDVVVIFTFDVDGFHKIKTLT